MRKAVTEVYEYENKAICWLCIISAGTPVVACNVAGAEEFIEVSGDGMTFKEDDAMDAATCIEKIVSNRDEMVKIGRLFANNSSMESYAQCLERLFQEVD